VYPPEFAAAREAYANMYRTGHIIQNDVGKGKVLIRGAWIPLELDRTTVNLMHNTIRDCNIANIAASKPEDRPARTEKAIGDCGLRHNPVLFVRWTPHPLKPRRFEVKWTYSWANPTLRTSF
jgi:hypothetical protein